LTSSFSDNTISLANNVIRIVFTLWAESRDLQLSVPVRLTNKWVIAIAAEGGDPAYPGVFAMEPEMLHKDFLFDTACNSSELA